jgi:beta-fructofuranosidase
VGWLRIQGNGAWNGCLSLPRHLTLDAAGELRIEPAAALQSLRRQPVVLDKSGPVSGNSLEIRATFTPGSGPHCGVELSDSQRDYPLHVDLSNGTIEALNESRPLERLRPGESLTLHIFIDCSVIEIFINGREALSTWLRPEFKPNGCWRVQFLQQPETVEIWELGAA